MDDQALRNRLVRKLLRMQVVGSHSKQVTTVVNASLPTHDRGRGKEILEQMATNPNAPVEWYGGGHRNAVRLTSIDDAVGYLSDHDGDVPFGFE